MSSQLRIVFEQDGYPRELIESSDVRWAVNSGALTADTEVTVYRSGQLPEVMNAANISELCEFFPTRGELLLDDPISTGGELILDDPISNSHDAASEVLELHPDRHPSAQGPSPEAFGGPWGGAADQTRMPITESGFIQTPSRLAKRHGTGGPRVVRAQSSARPSPASREPSFWYWAFLPFSGYTEFSGRARRREYWSYTLFLSIVAAVALGIGTTAMVLLTLGVFLPSWAVTVRRLHDMNASGWLILIALIPYVGLPILLVMFLVPGTAGPNIFGPDPKL